MSMIEKKFANKDLEIELTSYIDDKKKGLVPRKIYCYYSWL